MVIYMVISLYIPLCSMFVLIYCLYRVSSSYFDWRNVFFVECASLDLKPSFKPIVYL